MNKAEIIDFRGSRLPDPAMEERRAPPRPGLPMRTDNSDLEAIRRLARLAL